MLDYEDPHLKNENIKLKTLWKFMVEVRLGIINEHV